MYAIRSYYGQPRLPHLPRAGGPAAARLTPWSQCPSADSGVVGSEVARATRSMVSPCTRMEKTTTMYVITSYSIHYTKLYDKGLQGRMDLKFFHFGAERLVFDTRRVALFQVDAAAEEALRGGPERPGVPAEVRAAIDALRERGCFRNNFV